MSGGSIHDRVKGYLAGEADNADELSRKKHDIDTSVDNAHKSGTPDRRSEPRP